MFQPLAYCWGRSGGFLGPRFGRKTARTPLAQGECCPLLSPGQSKPTLGTATSFWGLPPPTSLPHAPHGFLLSRGYDKFSHILAFKAQMEANKNSPGSSSLRCLDLYPEPLLGEGNSRPLPISLGTPRPAWPGHSRLPWIPGSLVPGEQKARPYSQA